MWNKSIEVLDKKIQEQLDNMSQGSESEDDLSHFESQPPAIKFKPKLPPKVRAAPVSPEQKPKPMSERVPSFPKEDKEQPKLDSKDNQPP